MTVGSFITRRAVSNQTLIYLLTKDMCKTDLLKMFQRPLTIILLQTHRDTNGRRIVIHIGGAYTASATRAAYFCRSIAIDKWEVHRDAFYKYRGQGSI